MAWNYLRYHEPTEKSLVLKNLHCLFGWNPRYCDGSFFRLFPNLKKLQVRGVPDDFLSREDLYDFRCLDQLEELEFRVAYPCCSCFRESCTPSDPADDVQVLHLPPPDAFPRNL